MTKTKVSTPAMRKKSRIEKGNYFWNDGCCDRIYEEGVEKFDGQVAKEEGYVYREGFADGANWARWDDPETGETLITFNDGDDSATDLKEVYF